MGLEAPYFIGSLCQNVVLRWYWYHTTVFRTAGSTALIKQRVRGARPSRADWSGRGSFHFTVPYLISYLFLLLLSKFFLTCFSSQCVNKLISMWVSTCFYSYWQGAEPVWTSWSSTRLKQAARDNIRYQAEPGAPIINHHSSFYHHGTDRKRDFLLFSESARLWIHPVRELTGDNYPCDLVL